MNANVTTLLVAIFGVAGTLSSPLLAQWIAGRAKQQEFDLHHQERLEARQEARRRETFEERRSIYARLNTAARQYTQELRSYLRVITDNAPADEARDELEKARQTYRVTFYDLIETLRQSMREDLGVAALTA